MSTEGVSHESAGTISARLTALGPATLGEAGGRCLMPSIRAAWPGATICGPAFTAWCPPGDNLALHAAVAGVPGGHVLVVATGGASTFGYFGEVLATAAIQRGALGLVTDGGVRDVLAVERLGFAVFAAGAALRGTTKAGPGATGCTVALGEVMISPGDWIVADVDGVVVIGTSQLQNVLQAGEARAAKEHRMLKALRDGHTTADLLSLDLDKVQGHVFPAKVATTVNYQPDSIATGSTTA